MRFVIWVLVNAGALAVATALMSGIELTGDTTTDKVVTLLATEAPLELRKKVELAVKHCPTRALSLREKS